MVDDRQAVANEPLPLGIVLNDATGADAVVLTGLAEGTKLSAGAPMGSGGWRVPVRDIANVVAYPPASFVGVVDVLVELQSADAAPIDMQVARFEWTAKPNEARAARAATVVRKAAPVIRDAPVLPKTLPPAAPTAKLASDRVAWLVKRGLDFLKDGNFAATRLMLRPAADAGDAQAALLMGATYDPVVLAELGSVGLRPDPAAARAWYQRAKDFGSAEAPGRIERLAQVK